MREGQLRFGKGADGPCRGEGDRERRCSGSRKLKWGCREQSGVKRASNWKKRALENIRHKGRYVMWRLHQPRDLRVFQLRRTGFPNMSSAEPLH